MPNTDQFWMQDTPYTDMEIFVGPSQFKDTNGSAVFTFSSNLLYYSLTGGASGNFVADLAPLLKRTGMYGSPNLNQQQFGTAASQPGPSLVSGTSDPEGIRGFPPFTRAQLPTLVGPQSGPVAKGIQLNSIVALYQFNVSVANFNNVGLFSIKYDPITGVPTSTPIIVLGANGMASSIGDHITSIAVPTPVMLTTPLTEMVLQFQLGASSGGVLFRGAVLRCSYNFN